MITCYCLQVDKPRDVGSPAHVKRNPLEVRVTRGQNVRTEMIPSYCKLPSTVLNIFSKEITSNNTNCRKRNFEVHMKYLKVLVK